MTFNIMVQWKKTGISERMKLEVDVNQYWLWDLVQYDQLRLCEMSKCTSDLLREPFQQTLLMTKISYIIEIF